MVEKTKKTVQPRARIAHKLARYIRANPVHHQPGTSASRPSVSHLSKFYFKLSSRRSSSKKAKK